MTRHATPTDALAAALHSATVTVSTGAATNSDQDTYSHHQLTADAPERMAAALAEAGYTIVRSDDLLEIAGIAGADLSDIDHAGQLVHPPLLDYVATEVRALRQSYDECLKECE